MKNLKTTSLWCATLIAFGALNVACHHHEGTQNSKGGRHNTTCQPGQTVLISDVVSGHCAVNCDSVPVTKGNSAMFQPVNHASAFDVEFPLMPKATHDPGCQPGAGKVLLNPKFPVSPGGSPTPSGPTQQTGCYEYTIYPHGNAVACNDPNIVVN